MASDDKARDSLFGPSAKRNVNKPNPYADSNLNNSSSAAPSSQPVAASAPSPPSSSQTNAGSSSTSDADDPARAMLLAGGKKIQSKIAPPTPLSPSEAAGTTSQTMAMFEGDFEFDFADLNITSGAQGDAARALGLLGSGSAAAKASAAAAAMAADGSLDFAAIDSDMARFEKDELVRDALNRGVDLRVYSKQVDVELRHMETLSIADYIKESDSIAALFEQIQGCENVLNQMQSLLQGFQDNLGGISDEIRSLQEESLALSVKMQNRKNVGAKVKTFLAKVAMPETLISAIMEGEINEAWLRSLRSLAEKLEFLDRGSSQHQRASKSATTLALQQGSSSSISMDDSSLSGAYTDSLQDLSVNPLETPAAVQSVPIMRNLQAKAVQRVRDFLAKAIGEVCKPKTNMQKQQEYVLLKFSYAMAFLSEFGIDRERGTDSGREIRALYAREVGAWYGDIFKKYADELSKSLLPWTSKADVIANPESSQSGASSSSSSSANMQSTSGGAGGERAYRPADPFSVADRMSLLTDLANAPVLQSHVLQAEKSRISLETAFRSLLRHLSDVALAEEAFCRKFFGDREGRDVLSQTLSKAFAAALSFLDDNLPQSWDAPGALLIVALVSAQWVASGNRGSQCLDGFCLRAIESTRKRFRSIFDANVASLKAAAPSPKKTLGAFDVSPHIVSRNFANWSASILVLHRTIQQPSAQDQMLLAHMASVSKEIEALWNKMGTELSSGAKQNGALLKAAFLLNQYTVTFSIYNDRGVSGEDAQVISASHARAQTAYTDEAVDSTHFKVFAGWVRKTEAAAQAAHKQRGGAAFTPSILPSGVPSYLPDGLPTPGSLDAAETEAIVREFVLNWRTGLSALNDDVTRYFTGVPSAAGSGSGGATLSTNGASMAVLLTVFSRVAELHQRFGAILSRAFPTNPPFIKEMVTLQTVYAEARRYGQK
jgi:hypothetical protein